MDLTSCFEQIIDIHHVAPACKPQPESYLKALELSGETDPKRILVIDDSPRNLQTARMLGFYTILVGKDQPDPTFHLTLPRLHALPVGFLDCLAQEH